MWIIINLNKDPFGEEDVVGFKHILRKMYCRIITMMQIKDLLTVLA